MGTFLFDLLTEEKEEIHENQFHIDLLIDRLIETTQWILQQDRTSKLPIVFLVQVLKRHLHCGKQHIPTKKLKLWFPMAGVHIKP